MKKLFRFLFGWFTSRRALLALIAAQQREIALREGAVNYVTISVPTKEQINSRLSDLYHDIVFKFYLMALENEVLAMFREGKGEDIYRGGLRIVGQIKNDLNKAAVDVHKKAKANGQV